MVILGLTSKLVETALLRVNVSASPLVGEMMLLPFQTAPISMAVRLDWAGTNAEVAVMVPACTPVTKNKHNNATHHTNHKRLHRISRVKRLNNGNG